jgi:hypothetical protein
MSIRMIAIATVLAFTLVSCGKAIDPISQPGASGNNSDGGLLDYLGASGNSAMTVAKPYGTGIVELEWGLDDGKLHQSGLGASKLTTFLDYGGTLGRSFCFENTKHLHNCQVAKTETRNVVGSEPVAIQGFTLNFAKQSHNRHGADYLNYAIEGGWVATAELRFNTATGKMVLGNPGITQIYAGGCDLADTSGFTAGYFDRNRILTGLYMADEYAVTRSSYTDAFIHAAEVSYSAIVPNPKTASAGSNSDSCTGIFCWKFQTRPESSNATTPDNKAVKTAWGVKSFTETDTITSKASAYFGLTSSSPLPRWDSHVVIGFCIKGYKTEQNGTKRPLVHYSVARTHEPALVFKR